MADFEFFQSGKLKEKIYKMKRRITLRLNRFRANYALKKEGGHVRAVIPEHHRKTITHCKYFFTAMGLFSGLIVFSSVLIGFGFGILIFVISSVGINCISAFVFVYSSFARLRLG